MLERPAFFYAAAAAALLVMIAVSVLYMDTGRPRYDGRQMMFMAYNLAEKGVMSREQDDAVANPEPTFRREPLYPLILAGFIKAYPGDELRREGAQCFLKDDQCPGLIRFLKISGILLHAGLALATGWAAWVMTRRKGAALGGFVVICLYTGFMSVTNVFYAETLAALLMILLSTFFYRAFTGDGFRDSVLCGLSLGLLILTKAAFYYLLILCGALLPVLAGAAMLRKIPGSAAGRWLLMCVIACAVIAPWMARNHAISGDWTVAGRGGEVLSIRAQYDTMPWSDYPAAYLVFTPLIGDRLLQHFYGEEVWRRFDRETKGSYYDAAKTRQGVANDLAKEKNISLTEASLHVILENFGKHLALTGAFAYSGAFMQAYVRKQPLPLILVIFTAALSLPFVPAGLFLTGWAGTRRNWDVLVFLFPAYFSYAFHAFLTHYIPRYSMPLIPVFIVGMLVLICWLVERKSLCRHPPS